MARLAEARAGMSFPCRTPEHLLALLKEKLEALDAGFGVDILVLAAVQVERRDTPQAALGARLSGAARSDPALLVDRLANHLGAGRVSRLEPRASHIPERAEARMPALRDSAPARGKGQPPWPVGPAAPAAPRPPLLLVRARADPRRRRGARRSAGPLHLAPGGAPRRTLQGPQRIAPEWWREIGTKTSRTRDYYRIEDEGGAGYWVLPRRALRARRGAADVVPARAVRLKLQKVRASAALRRAAGHDQLLFPAWRLARRGARRAGEGAGARGDRRHRPQHARRRRARASRGEGGGAAS